MRTILRNATVIDCVRPTPVEGATVTVRDGRIEQVLRGGAAPSDASAADFDLTGCYLMPGLWDVHVHPDYLSLADVPLADQVTLFGHRLMEALTESGITGFRCAGTHSFMDVPTLAISHLTQNQASNDWERAWAAQRNLPASLCCRADAASDVHAHWFRRALDAGVRMALGSDIRPLKDAALLEMGLWVKDGATPWQTLLAATANAAALCGVGDELGTVEPGKRADLIVVGANPLEDIDAVRDLRMVLKDGLVVSDLRG